MQRALGPPPITQTPDYLERRLTSFINAVHLGSFFVKAGLLVLARDPVTWNAGGERLCIPTFWYGESRSFARLAIWPLTRSVARTRANPTRRGPHPYPNAVAERLAVGMEKLELDDFSISPSNHRGAEFHRLIKNGHFWGKVTPFFSRSPSPSWAVLGAPDLSIAH